MKFNAEDFWGIKPKKEIKGNLYLVYQEPTGEFMEEIYQDLVREGYTNIPVTDTRDPYVFLAEVISPSINRVKKIYLEAVKKNLDYPYESHSEFILNIKEIPKSIIKRNTTERIALTEEKVYFHNGLYKYHLIGRFF